MFTTKPIACVAVISDVVTDQRVLKTSHMLVEQGYEVYIIGRQIKRKAPVSDPGPFKIILLNLWFNSGPWMYAHFAWKLFFKLVHYKPQLIIANDLDTLWASVRAKKRLKSKLIYDSHEYFCEVPELQNHPIKKAVWRFLERKLLPQTNARITVSHSIAKAYEATYGIKFEVVRNVPVLKPRPLIYPTRKELGLPEFKTLVILQGAGINKDRGAEELIEAMAFLPEMYLCIIGSGDVWNKIYERSMQPRFENRIRCIPRISKSELFAYTRLADIGISIDKPNNLNYKYSLPNKIFDYFEAGIPVLCSRLPELEALLTQFPCGHFIDHHQPEHIAAQLKQLASSPLIPQYKKEALRAAATNHWDIEKQIWIRLLAFEN